MKKTLLFTSMVAMLFAFGCSKEMDNPNADSNRGRGTHKVTIGASLELPAGVSTKSTLDSDGAFAWTDADRIWVNTTEGFEYLSWAREGADAASASFTGLISGNIISDGYGVFPVYCNGNTPLNMPQIEESNVIITLPSKIAWVAGEANNVMVGKISGGNLPFQNVGGMFMVTIGNMPSDARKITFTTGKRISGDFAVTTDPDDGNHYIINTDETNTNGVTFTFTSEQIASEMVFYVPAPIGEYAGLAFQVKDANNNVLASFNGSTSKTITRKKLIILPKLNFASVGGNGENGTGSLTIPANYTTDGNHGVFLLPSTTSDLEVLIYEESTVTIRYSEGEKPANVALIAQNAIETLNIELPDSHVTLNGANTSSTVTINNVEATTSTSTFVVGAGIQIGSDPENPGLLTIKGGSLTLGAPVVGTVKVNIPETNTNTTDEKVNIVINSAITNLEVKTAATQDNPDKVWVSINAGASVSQAIAVPEVNCNLYIAKNASATTVNTKAEETTIEGTVGAIIASKSTQEGAEAPTVTVTKTATVSTSISATGGATVFVDEYATGAGTATENQTKDEQSSINETSGEIVAVIGTDNYATLTAAFAAAQNGQTVKLMKDYDATGETMYDSYRNLGIDKGIIFDGAGHILVVKGRGIAVGAAAESIIDVTFKDITIKNSTNAARCVDTRGHIGTLTLDNAKLDTQGASGAYTQPLTIGGNQAAIANIIIKNGSVIQTNDDATAYYAIITFNPVNMSITGSTITGWAAIYMKGKVSSEGSHGSTVNIVNSTINARNVYAGYTNEFAAFALEDSDIAINITNSTLNVHGDSNYQAIVSFDNGDANCNNQTVNLGEGNTVNLTGAGLFRFPKGNETCSLIITGGTFTKDPSAYCAAGYVATQSGNVWTVAPISGVAAIGTQGYETLAAAFAAVNNNETITMLADVALTDRIFVNAGATPTLDSGNRYATSTESKTITLDLNGHNITSTSNFAQAGGTFNITNTGTVNENHGVISTTTAGLAPVEVRGTGDLNAKRTLNVGTGVTLTGTTYGLNVFGSNTADLNKIEVNVNGTVNGTIFVLGNLKNTANDISINVNGKVYVAAIDDDKRNVGVALNGYASVNVASTANVEGETGIEVRAGQLTVANGATIKANSSFSYEANGSGSTTAGAAIAVVQHTTGLPITATINGGTLTGVKKLYVKDEMGNYLDNVAVSAVEAIKNEAEIPAGFVWQANGNKFDLVRFFAAQIGETKYATLAEAIAAVPTDGTKTTIQMLADETMATGATLEVASTKNIVLDLNGKTVTGNGGVNGANFFFLTNRGVLEITDSSAGKNGKITGYWTNPNTGWGNQYNTIYNIDGKLTLSAGTVETTTGYLSYAINNSSNAWGVGDDKETVFTMTGGTVTAPSGDAAVRVYQNCGSNSNPYSHNTLNISGGLIKDSGIFVDTFIYKANPASSGDHINTTINISGGEIHGLIDLKMRHPYNTTVNVTGGSFRSSTLRVRKYVSEWGTGLAEPTEPVFNISNGDFQFSGSSSSDAFAVIKSSEPSNVWTSYANQYSITGGTFNVDPSDYVAAGYGVTRSGDDYVVAAVTTTWDGSSKAALTDLGDDTYGIYSAAQLAQFAADVNGGNHYDGKTVKLWNSIDLNNNAWTPIGNVTSARSPIGNGFLGTFEGNNKTISKLSVTAHNGVYSYAGLFGSINPSGQTVTIQNLKIDNFAIDSYHFAGAILGETGHDSVTGKVAIKNCYVSNGNITTTPWNTGNGVYDDGNQAGGLVGSAYNYAYEITGNTVYKVNITGYRAIGGIAGFMTSATFTNNTVSSCNITQSNTNAYYGQYVWKLNTVEAFVGQRGSSETNYNNAWSYGTGNNDSDNTIVRLTSNE